MPRDDFSPDIKRRLAQRAGYLCSICSQITIGPSDETNESVNLTGVAAHISGASPGVGSRRYNPGLTPEYRASIENGIWLCNTHADLIDGDEETYTIEYLKLIKKNHEEKIKFKQAGINVEKGLITKVELCNLARIRKHTELDFTEKNILAGGNGVGKTLICEFIAALTNKKYLDRWTNGKREVNGYFNIHYFKNQANKFSISISDKNEVSYAFNEAEIPLLIMPLNIFYLKEDFRDFVSRSKKYDNFLNYFAEYFSLTLNEFCSVITSLAKTKKYYLNDIRLNDERDDLLVKIGSGAGHAGFKFHMLSSGEQQRVFVEIALKIAEYYSKFSSTILMIEQSAIPTIDHCGINHLLEIVRNNTFNFQFFMTFYEELRYFDVEGFKAYHLKRTNDEVTISEWKAAQETVRS